MKGAKTQLVYQGRTEPKCSLSLKTQEGVSVGAAASAGEAKLAKEPDMKGDHKAVI